MDSRESIRDSAKVFHEGLHVQLAAKLLYLKTFMAYGIYTQSNIYTYTTGYITYHWIACSDKATNDCHPEAMLYTQ